jgi:hypothetical protein
MNVSQPTLQRRGALAWLSAGLTAATWPAIGRSETARTLPMLGTHQQLQAERFILHMLKDDELLALQRRIKAELLRSPIGQTREGADTVDRAIAQWTNSLLFAEACKHRQWPAFLWGTDDTPRHWFGYTLDGVGTSGDNPDAIYRTAVIDGSKQYEVMGWIDRERPAAQLVFETDRADMAQPASVIDMNGGKPDVVSATLNLLTDRDLPIAADGSFRLVLGGEGEGPGYLKLKPGVITVGTRDLLSDWRQRPARLTIRELGVPQPRLAFEALDYELLKRNALADLPGYVRFWSKFPEIWFGGLKPNSISEPLGRNGGWGFVAGCRFVLQSDEAIVVTTGRGGAGYTGFQINDPWMIAPDARRNQVCLNLSQVTPSPDGTVTYVIAERDPGVANWLDTVGCNAGMGILRWQAMPPGSSKDGLIHDFRKVTLSELAAMRQIPRITPAQRAEAVAARATAYATRTS